jgi:hypothetical protein
MSTFNGWTIYTLPSVPAVPKAVEWQFNDKVGQAPAEFTFQKQIFPWGQGIIKASLSYQLLTNAQMPPWSAFLASLQGTAGVFLFGDPMNTGPQNGGATAGTVTGSGQAGNTLVTSSSGLLPGDWFSLGVRLYMVTSVSGGVLGIWPNIRESPAGGTSLVITNTQGLFRLQKNVRGYSVNTSKLYALTFEIEEAL